MLVHQTISKLEALGLNQMAAGLEDQLGTPGTYDELSFCDRLGLLVDKEADARDSRPVSYTHLSGPVRACLYRAGTRRTMREPQGIESPRAGRS